MIELEHAWGAGRSHKYIAKIGNRYFYTQDEIQAYKQGAQKKAGNAFDAARKGALTVKKKADSVPRIQKHGSKYYVADKKTQRKIEKSGAGGNKYYIGKPEHINGNQLNLKWTPAGKARTRSEELKGGARIEARDSKKAALRKKMGYSFTPGDNDSLTPAVRAAKHLAMSKAYEGASKGIEKKYSKYELGNVTGVNQGKKKLKQLGKKIGDQPLYTEKTTISSRLVAENGKPVKNPKTITKSYEKNYTVRDAKNDIANKAKETKNDLNKTKEDIAKKFKKKASSLNPVSHDKEIKSAQIKNEKIVYTPVNKVIDANGKKIKVQRDAQGNTTFKDVTAEYNKKEQTKKIKKNLKKGKSRSVKSHYGELNR